MLHLSRAYEPGTAAVMTTALDRARRSLSTWIDDSEAVRE
jgi:hypothetical protein